MKPNYRQLLFNPKWKEKREEILQRDNNKCVICGNEEHLHIHHKQYHFSESLHRFVNPWEYQNKYFITVCNECHERGHSLYNVPTKKIK